MSCTSGLKVRTVPCSSAVSGMTLLASPAWNWQMLTTAQSSGSIEREIDRLHRDDDLRADQHRVDAFMRAGGMAALAMHGDGDAVGRGQHRAGDDARLAQRQAGVVVHAIDGIAGEAVEQAFLDHHAAAAAAFFRRLEDEVHRAVEVARLGQVARRAEQHGGVPVMPAGMHLPRIGGAMGEVVGLGHRQAIHVGAEADGAARNCRCAARRPGRCRRCRDAPRSPRTASCCATRSEVRVLLEAEFRMRVDVPARGGRGRHGNRRCG